MVTVSLCFLHCNSQEHFELEPLNGTPPHLLLVVRRGLKPEGKSEVLGMLMDEAEREPQRERLPGVLTIVVFGCIWAGEYAPKPSETLVYALLTCSGAAGGGKKSLTCWMPYQAILKCLRCLVWIFDAGLMSLQPL